MTNKLEPEVEVARRHAAAAQPPSQVTRFSWTIADQALSSGTNAILSFAAAHSLSRQQFGWFSLAFGLWIVVLGVSRTTVSEPLMIVFSGTEGRRWREAEAGSLSAALFGGLGLGVVLVAAAPIVPPGVRLPLVVLAIGLPGLLLQDAIRYSSFAAGRPWGAVLCDLVWAAALFLPAALLLQTQDPTAAQWLGVWGLGAYVAAAAVVLVRLPRLQVTRARAWWREQRALSGPFTLEFLLYNGSVQVVAVAVGAIASVSEAGAVRGAAVVLGPLMILITGAVSAATPQAVGLLSQPPAALDGFVTRVSAVLALALTAGFAVLLVPDTLGEVLLGATWEGAHDVLAPTVAVMVLKGLTTGPTVGLHALGQSRACLRLQLVLAPLTVAAGCAGAAVAGARGAITGVAFARLLGLPLWWRRFRQANRRSRSGDGLPVS